MPIEEKPIAHTGGLGVTLQGVRRVFDGGVAAIDGVDLRIEPGQFVAFLGPSGCGKSTLLRLIAGLDKPTAGQVVLDDVGRQVTWGGGATGRRTRRPVSLGSKSTGLPSTADQWHQSEPLLNSGGLAFVFQDAHLLPWRNVLRNVALPLELKGVPKHERLDAARLAIEEVGLTDAITRYPAQLSGGMKMRVSLARALVTRPRLLLLDEPFAALDEMTRQRLDEQLHQLWSGLGMTVLFVTHSISEATFLAQRAVVFSKRPARTVVEQPIELPIERTADLRTQPRFNEIVRGLYQRLEREGV